jgi:hypothetical protein
MARVDRPVGFRGPLSRWIEPGEARTLARKLAGIKSRAGLARWLASPEAEALGSATSLLGYRVRLGCFPDGLDGAAIRSLIVRVAALRRLHAIAEHATANRMNVPAAVGSDRSRRSLARCPACDESLDAATFAPSRGEVYCEEHKADEEAELDELLG